jgi:hypothetical protein|tara:strand:- start:132 stop:431 length:300 start_codon:yes stop_codon:yes gene_type:complete
MKATEETKQKAKEAGIKSWHVKSEEKLQAELAELEAPEETVTVDSAETVVEEVTPEPADDLIDLMEGCTWDRAAMAIKMNGKKSKFYPFREVIEKKLKK